MQSDAPPLPPAVPMAHDKCDAAWVDAAMRAKGLLGRDNRVVAVQREALGGGGSTGALVVRLQMTYAQAAEGLPRTAILKYSDVSRMVTPLQRPDPFERAVMHGAGYSDVRMLELECSFYDHVGAAVRGVCPAVDLPGAYYSAMKGRSTRLSAALFICSGRLERAWGAVLMEDLGGGRSYDAVEEIPEGLAVRVVQVAAQMHAATARAVLESPLAFAPAAGRAFNYDMNSMSVGLPKMVKLAAFGPRSNLGVRVRTHWGSSDLKVLVDEPDTFDALQTFVHRYAKVRRALRRRRPFKCVVHGDMHAGNYMFMPDGSMKIFDWQSAFACSCALDPSSGGG
jgi:hypothetical protein